MRLVLFVAGELAFAAATVPLVFRDVNILAVTDVHAWLAGGDRETTGYSPSINSTLDATFGDLVSFADHAKSLAAAVGKDVFLVDNGDIVDGTGLSNAADDHCDDILPLYSQVPFDALNCGNHELYSNLTMRRFENSGYISGWRGAYLTSNLIWSDGPKAGRPIGARFKYLRGVVSNVSLLTFGFMYDMAVAEGRCTAVNVVNVSDALRAEWFTAELRSAEAKAATAVVVLAHADAQNPLLAMIVRAIREFLPLVPIQIIAGHSHARSTARLDARAAAFEPGNYFNTVGYASFDVPRSDGAPRAAASRLANGAVAGAGGRPVRFHFRDVDTSAEALAAALGTTPRQLPTAKGRALSVAIAAKRDALGECSCYVPLLFTRILLTV
jgi:2',3'-cyclic-nucleotide 2'-phosphodiesterase (5'-nucleotidase family)